MFKNFYAIFLIFFIVWSTSCFAESWQEAKDNLEQLLEQGQYDLAALFEGPKLVKNFPQEADAYYLYSYSLYLNGDFASAELELKKAQVLVEDIPSCYFWLNGLLEAANNNIDTAFTLLEKAYELRPSYDIAMDIGRIVWQKGNYAKALEAYELATNFPEGKKQPWAYLNQAKLLSYQGNYQEAIKVLNFLLELIRKQNIASLNSIAYVETLYQLGKTYEQLNDIDNARLNYQATLEVNPNYFLASNALTKLVSKE